MYCIAKLQWNSCKLDSLYTGIPSIPNMACGPNSTFSYINNPFNLDILSCLEGVTEMFHCTFHTNLVAVITGWEELWLCYFTY